MILYKLHRYYTNYIDTEAIPTFILCKDTNDTPLTKSIVRKTAENDIR